MKLLVMVAYFTTATPVIIVDTFLDIYLKYPLSPINVLGHAIQG